MMGVVASKSFTANENLTGYVFFRSRRPLRPFVCFFPFVASIAIKPVRSIATRCVRLIASIY